MRLRTRSVACTLAAAMCLGLAVRTQAQAFAADVVIAKPGAPARAGRIYVSHELVRLEVPDLPGGFFVLDAAREAAWFVRPQQWVFMDAKQSSALTQVFIAVDPADPCDRWHSMTAIAAVTEEPLPWRCDRRGEGDRDDGLVRYHVVSLRDRESDRWIDPARRFPLKWQNDDGTLVTLEHIVDGPQEPDLFAIPRTYKKFDPLALIEQIKLSDVWVKPSGE